MTWPSLAVSVALTFVQSVAIPVKITVLIQACLYLSKYLMYVYLLPFHLVWVLLQIRVDRQYVDRRQKMFYYVCFYNKYDSNFL